MFNIRPITEDDLGFVNVVRNQSREFLHDNREFSLDDTYYWYRTTKPKWFIINLEDYNLDMPIGYFRTKKLNSRIIEIGADIDPYFQGKGFGKKAYIQFINYLFNEKKYQDITLEVLANNTKAYSLYRSLGFNVNNESMPIEIIRGRERILSISMELSKEDWNARP